MIRQQLCKVYIAGMADHASTSANSINRMIQEGWLVQHMLSGSGGVIFVVFERTDTETIEHRPEQLLGRHRERHE